MHIILLTIIRIMMTTVMDIDIFYRQQVGLETLRNWNERVIQALICHWTAFIES